MRGNIYNLLLERTAVGLLEYGKHISMCSGPSNDLCCPVTGLERRRRRRRRRRDADAGVRVEHCAAGRAVLNPFIAMNPVRKA